MRLSELLTALSIPHPAGLAARDADLTSVAALADAGPDQLAFCRDAKNARGLPESRAAAVLVPHALAQSAAAALLVPCDSPDHAFAVATDLLMPEPPAPAAGIHRTATVDPSASVDPSAYVGPGCVIGARVTVGARVRLDANVVLEADVTVGDGSRLWPGVAVLYRCVIGRRVMIGANSVIGHEGFGLARMADGRWIRIPHRGNAVVEDDVEMGGCCTVDRARFGRTRVGRGCKFDDSVHIGHGADVGENCAFAAMATLAGTVVLGNGVQIGGHGGVGGHAVVGDNVEVSAYSAAMKDTPAGEAVMGFPARPRTQVERGQANVYRLDRLFKQVRELADRLDAIDPGGDDAAQADPDSYV